MFLTNFASKVILVHRRDELRSEKILQKRLFENEKVEIMWDTTLLEILGTDGFPEKRHGHPPEKRQNRR